jgi:hypothetical protein
MEAVMSSPKGDIELPITYIPISGPGVDMLENRKETGQPIAVTETEMRDSYESVKGKLFAGMKRLVAVNK